MEHGNIEHCVFELINEGTITDVRSFFASSCHCGIRKFREDFCILFTPEQSTCSGTFTKNKFAAAPVVLNKEQLKKTRDIKAIIINSGISNACTGSKGIENSKLTIELASKYLNLSKDNILVASTGRIGIQLPMDKIEKGIITCSKNLSRHGGHNASRAILTIDKNPKEVAVKYKLGDKEITIGGVCKGSGMGEDFENFKKALHYVLKSLALKVVEDGEGATKTIEINVIKAKDKEEARNIGKKIANSILFKSAMFGEDLNWGRIAAAIGSVENQIDKDRIDIYFEDFAVMKNGQAIQYDGEHGNN